MAIADNAATRVLPSWLPQMPIGTTQVLLGVLLVFAIGSGVFMLFRSRKHARLNEIFANAQHDKGDAQHDAS